MEAKLLVVLSIQNGVNHGFMVRLNDSYKINVKGNSVVIGIYVLTYHAKQTFNRVIKNLFWTGVPAPTLIKSFYYNAFSSIRKSSMFVNKNHILKNKFGNSTSKKIEVSYFWNFNNKYRWSSIVMSQANPLLVGGWGAGEYFFYNFLVN